MNIRIGNDVTLHITLDESKFQGKTLTKAVCYLQNVDRHTETKCEEKPHVAEVVKPKSYIPTKYTIHGCGIPGYNVAFGVYPHDRGLNVCDHHQHEKKRDKSIYVTEALIQENQDIQCVFPKHTQRDLGRYRLVVETAVKDNFGVYTYTFDFGTVFSLTDNIFGKVGDITVEVPNLTGSIKALRAVNNIVVVDQGSSITINSIDKYDTKYAILAGLYDDSVVQYDPVDWQYSNVKFKSSDPTVVSIDDNGTITAVESKIGRDVTITAYDEDDILVNTSFVVHIVGSTSDYTAQLYSTQVYDPLNKLNQSQINSNILASIKAMESMVGKTVDGMFLVVTTQDKYEQLVSLNQIKDDTFYFTYEGDEEPDNPDKPDTPDKPDIPTVTSRVVDHVLYTSGTINAGIITLGGSVTNNILKL